MTNPGDENFEKKGEESKETSSPAAGDALESTQKAGELEKRRLDTVREKRKSLGHLSDFSLGSGAVLEIIDRSSDAAKQVFRFDASELQERTALPSSGKTVFDETGRLSAVTYPSGLSAEVTYKSSGRSQQPEEIRLSNGTTLEKKPDGSWGQTADDTGAVIAEYRKVKVAADGTIKFEGADGALSWSPGGTTTVTDKSGTLSKVTYPSGLLVEVAYDAPGKDGQPNKITLSNDTTLLSNEDGTWSQIADRSGVILMEYASIAVKPDGTIQFENDAFALSWNLDGSAIRRDEQGRLSNVAYSSGLSAEIKYAETGGDQQPTTLQLSNDTTLEKNSDGSWSQKSSGSGTLLAQYKSIVLGGDGAITFEGEGHTIVWRRDGTTIATDHATGMMTRLQPDGSREKVN